MENNKYDKEININLSKKYQILSKYIAFYCLIKENSLTEEELLEKKFKEIESVISYDYSNFVINVELLTAKNIPLYVSKFETTKSVKLKIEDKEGIPPVQ